MGVSFPALSSGSPISNSELSTNFADCINATRGLGTNNLATNAGILSSQIADRFIVVPTFLRYFERLGATNVYDLSGALRQWTLPNVVGSPGEEFDRFPALALPVGRAAYLAGASIRAQAITAGGGGEVPQMTLSHNGTVLGNGPVNIAAADTDYFMMAGDPYSDPQRSIADGDYFTVGWGRNGAGAPAISVATLTLYWLFELTSGG